MKVTGFHFVLFLLGLYGVIAEEQTCSVDGNCDADQGEGECEDVHEQCGYWSSVGE